MSSAAKGSEKGGRGGGGPPRKESILELAKLMDAKVRVKCLGGRELEGTRLIRVCVYLKDPEDMERITDKTRKLGLIVLV
jgi:hypothetical protein